MSEASLHERVGVLDKESAELDDALKAKDREIKTAADRKSRLSHLQSEIEGLEKEVKDLSKSVESMNTEVTDFPTDTQVLKLERRVQHLRDQLKDLDRQKQQNKTGIDAYLSRQAESVAARDKMVISMLRDLDTIASSVDSEVSKEAAAATTDGALDDATVATQITADREHELQQLCHGLSKSQTKDQELTASILAAQSKAEREGPAIEKKAQEMLDRINAAWADEKQALQRAYDKLFVINKEHRYHLARGTHVKRAAIAVSHEQALSARHAHLASQMVDLNGQLSVLADDNRHTRRLIEKLKSDGKQAAATFESHRIEVQQRLDAAKAAHNGMVEESFKFRSLKSELQNVLQDVRQGHSPNTRL